MLTLILLTFVLVAAAVLGLAVGTIVSGRCLRGSCGGAEVFGPDGVALSCDTCPRRREVALEAEQKRGPNRSVPV